MPSCATSHNKPSKVSETELVKSCDFFIGKDFRKIFVGETVLALIAGQWDYVCVRLINKHNVTVMMTDRTEVNVNFFNILYWAEETKFCILPKPISNEPIGSLSALMGLNKEEMSLQSIYDRLLITKQQGIGFDHLNLNVQIIGSSGSKVAQQHVDMLKQIGVLPSSARVSTQSGLTVSELTTSSFDVFIVNDAQALVGKASILRALMIASYHSNSDKDGMEPVWILTGTAKGLEKCMSDNVALRANFPLTIIADEAPDQQIRELEGLFRGHMAKVHSKCNIPEITSNTTNVPAHCSCADCVGKAQALVEMARKTRESEKNNEGWILVDHMSTTDTKPGKSNPQSLIIPSADKTDTLDDWGNVWTWDKMTRKWVDPFGSYSLQPLIRTVGTVGNPIISPQKGFKGFYCISWAYDKEKGCFFNVDKRSETIPHYPNGLKPQPKQLKILNSDVKYLHIALQRLVRGKEGADHAAGVKKLFFTVMNRQAERLAREKVTIRPDAAHPLLTNDVPFDPLYLLTKADILGAKAIENVFETSAAWKELLSMEGLHEVKASLRELMELCVENSYREERGQPLLQVALNRIFLGNPGTGKTTVAKLYGRILADLGLLSKGDVIYKTPSAFKGKYVGYSEAQTTEILKSAMGNVLVIDEAYGLYPVKDGQFAGDCYNEAIVTTIVEQVMGTMGEDRAVVMLGYREDMDQMLTYANPGLARRFQMDNALVFSDFDDSALQRILQAAVQKDQLVMSEETAVHAIKQLAKAKALPHFGNAGAVNNLYSDAKLRFQTRQRALSEYERSDELLGVDFTRPLTTQTEEELFADVVGCDTVREKLHQMERTIAFAKRLGRSDPKTTCEFNYVFTGNPGTGKTTVARLMGKMFCKLGLIPCEDVVEVSASDLITGYVGQAGKKTRDMLTKARGKVLFIDEAYQLNPKHGGQYMQEVVDEMVKSLTSEEFKGKLVVILAGYEQSVDEMLQANPGLKSRFPSKIHFANFSPETVHTILLRKIENENLQLNDCAETDLLATAEKLVKVPDFANGRDVQTYFKHVFNAIALRYSESNGCQGSGGDDGCDVRVTAQDLCAAFRSFVADKSDSRVDQTDANRIHSASHKHSSSALGKRKAQFVELIDSSKHHRLEVVQGVILSLEQEVQSLYAEYNRLLSEVPDSADCTSSSDCVLDKVRKIEHF